MPDPEQLANYRTEAALLAEIGTHLIADMPRITVRLPVQLADAATAAWHRDDEASGSDGESPEERTVRHSAGDLALIGLAIEERGERSDAWVTVDIDVNTFAGAIRAAEPD